MNAFGAPKGSILQSIYSVVNTFIFFDFVGTLPHLPFPWAESAMSTDQLITHLVHVMRFCLISWIESALSYRLDSRRIKFFYCSHRPFFKRWKSDTCKTKTIASAGNRTRFFPTYLEPFVSTAPLKYGSHESPLVAVEGLSAFSP